MFTRVTTTALPRVACAAVCVGVALTQRRLRTEHSKTLDSFTTSHYSSVCPPPAAMQPPQPAAAAARSLGLGVSSSGSSTVLRSLVQLLQSMWLSVSVALGATVTATMAAALTQLKMTSRPTALADAEQLDRSTMQQFCGDWVKVGPSSDSMSAFCDLFGVPRWLRRATRLMTGVQIYMTDDALVIKQVCKLGWLSAVETFPLDGSASRPHKRRDMRGGKQTGRLLAAHDGSVTVSVCWQGCLPGSAVDVLQLQQTPQGPVLVVMHKAQVEGRGTAQFKEVFQGGAAGAGCKLAATASS